MFHIIIQHQTIKYILVVLFSFEFFLNGNAQEKVECDSFSLEELRFEESLNSLSAVREKFDELIQVKPAIQDTLMQFVICKGKDVVYTEVELQEMIYLGSAYFEISSIDKAITIFEEVLHHSIANDYSIYAAIAHNYLGIIADIQGDWLTAYFHFEKLLTWEENNTKALNTSAYLNTGVVYASLGNFEKAELYYKKGIDLGKDLKIEYGWLLHRMAELKHLQNLNQEAEQYLIKAKNYWEKEDYLRGACFSDSQLGAIYQKTKSTQAAIDFLHHLITLNEYEGYNLCKIGLNLNLGIAYAEEKLFNQALKYLWISVDLSKEAEMKQYRIIAFEKIIEIYLAENRVNEALEIFRSYGELYKSLNQGNQQQTTSSFNRIKKLIEKEQDYKLVLQREEHVIQRLNAQKIINRISLVLLLLSSLSGAVFYYFYGKQKKSSRQLLGLNQEISQKQKDLEIAKQKIDKQNRELEMQLVKKAMVIGEYGEKVDKVKTMLKGDEFYSMKDKIMMTLNQMDNSDLQEELNMQITNANQEFFKKLSEKFPDLTQSELRLCAFLKMNLSTKEIANITFKRSESIKVARSRLRKKLGLTHNKMAITVFLNQV